MGSDSQVAAACQSAFQPFLSSMYLFPFSKLTGHRTPTSLAPAQPSGVSALNIQLLAKHSPDTFNFTYTKPHPLIVRNSAPPHPATLPFPFSLNSSNSRYASQIPNAKITLHLVLFFTGAFGVLPVNLQYFISIPPKNHSPR